MIQLLHATDERESLAHRVSIAAVFALCFAIGLTTWFSIPWILRFSTTLPRAAFLAIISIAIAAGVTALTVKCFRSHPSILLHKSIRAIPWIVPVVIFSGDGGPPSILPTAVFALASAKLLRYAWPNTDSDSIAIAAAEVAQPFSELPNGGTNLYLLTSFLCLTYFGLLEAFQYQTEISLPCIAAGCFSVAWLAGRQARNKPRASKTVAYVLFAVAATFISLLPPRNVGSGGTNMTQAHQNDEQLHSAVILLAEPKLKTKITFHDPNRFRVEKRRLAVPGIPFSGQYWFFSRPLRTPPQTSLIEKGDPTKVDVAAVEMTTLFMQAHQRLVKPIDMRCCSSIDVTLSGHDAHPETVRIELILLHSSIAVYYPNNSQSLGTQSLAHPTGDSTYRFAMPTNPPFSSFEEIVIWFHLDRPRTGQAATVLIERFDLIR